MSSGLQYNQRGFLPWQDEPHIYYLLDLRGLAQQARQAAQPGEHFHSDNYNLVLLGMILERVTDSTISAYLEEKLWQPLGMEFPASWSLDSSRPGRINQTAKLE